MGLGPLTVIVPAMFPIGRGTKSTVKSTVFVPATRDTNCTTVMSWPPTVWMKAVTVVLVSGKTGTQYAFEPVPSQSLLGATVLANLADR